MQVRKTLDNHPDWTEPKDIPELPGARRVLVISHMFPHPDQPGSGPFIHEQVQALRQAGVDARVVCGRPYWLTSIRSPLGLLLAAPRIVYSAIYYARLLYASRRRWWLHEGVPVCYVPYLVVAPFWSHGLAYRLAVGLSTLWMPRTFRPELVHAHTAYLDGSAALLLARRWRIPYVITEHTGPFDTLMTRGTIIRNTTLKALAGAARVISVSRALQSDVLRWLKGSDVRAEVIPNVVNTTRFAPTPLAAASSASPRILFVGYFVPVKNVPLLLDAFARVLAVRPRARLTLVGGGSTAAETAAVHAGIAERALIHAVTVRGWLPRDEVARCMQDNDMLVLPSRSETFGCVVAEALATGRPAVATRCGGPEDIVTEPWMGALCDNGDPQALAEAILAVADRLPQTDPQQLSASAQARFGAPAIAGRLARLYDTLVGGGTRAAR